MKKVLSILGHLWMFPNTLLISLLVIPLSMLRQISYYGRSENGIIFEIKPKGWAGKLLTRFDKVGISLGHFIGIREDFLGVRVLVFHEDRHVQQQMLFGIFHLPAYVLCHGILWVYAKVTNKTDFSAYRSNPFEVDARRYAGRRALNK